MSKAALIIRGLPAADRRGTGPPWGVLPNPRNLWSSSLRPATYGTVRCAGSVGAGSAVSEKDGGAQKPQKKPLYA